MENETNPMENEIIKKESPFLIPLALIFAAAMISGAWVYSSRNPKDIIQKTEEDRAEELANAVVPVEGVVLPTVWGNLGSKLVEAGAIDGERFRALYGGRGQWSDELEQMLSGQTNNNIVITRENAEYLLNMFWALGLANKNEILETGEMMTRTNGDVSGFASTAGWTMAVGDAMSHYSMHQLFDLTPEQQQMVDIMSRGIFRPCCGNSTHLPDCNHGMAMLGFLELMASQGATEEEMWNAALAVNSYWFPDMYQTVASYIEAQGLAWTDVSARELLSATYSSGSGFANIKSKSVQPAKSGGGGCSV